jgi:hypothetical protein
MAQTESSDESKYVPFRVRLEEKRESHMTDYYPTRGVPNPVVHIQDGSRVIVGGSGRLCCVGQAPDFQPVSADNVLLRLDGGQLGTADAPRGGGDAPRGVAPPNLTWPVRGGRLGTAPGATAPAPTDAAGLELLTQNGRSALAFGDGAAGLSLPWGPFTGASFTVIALVRARRAVNAYGPYPGTGTPIPILTSPDLAFHVPTGGPAPAALGGVPWDVACLTMWRVVTLENDATTGFRSVYVDEHLAARTAASTAPLAAGTVVLGGAGLEVAELIVWDAVLTPQDVATTFDALGAKWDVTVAEAQAPNTVVPSPTDATNAWPASVPTPGAWYDAALPESLFWDAAGTQATPPGGLVARWRDASGHGRDWTLGTAAGALWRTDSTLLALGGRGGVQVAGGTAWPPGLFAGIGGGAFTVVAVVRRLPGSTAHPFNVGGTAARFGSSLWIETVGTNDAVAVAQPPPAWTASAPLLCCWERSAAGTLAYRVGALDPAVGGTHHQSTKEVTDATWTSTAPVSVGTTNNGLILAAAAVWSGVSLTATQRGAMMAWLTARWGLAAPTTPATTLSFTYPAVPVPSIAWQVGAPDAARKAPDGAVAAASQNDRVVALRPTNGSTTLQFSVNVVDTANIELVPQFRISTDGIRGLLMPPLNSGTRLNVYNLPNLGLRGRALSIAYRTRPAHEVDQWSTLLFMGNVRIYRYQYGGMYIFPGGGPVNHPGYAFTQDFPVVGEARMAVVLRFNADDSISWCHSTNASKTIRTMAMWAGSLNVAFATMSIMGYDANSWSYGAELFELRWHNAVLSDAEMQTECANLMDLYPPVIPTYV